MCGIAGYISSNKYDTDIILDSLNHRGPDSRGFYSDFLFSKNIFLGHTRLKIIDLSPAGNQPMYSNDKNIVLIFNGEIYNYKELKEKYLPGVPFSSKTDTEVILKLYEKSGIESIKLLNGDFAIAILDKNLNKLFLIRDRLGVKPLYYSSRDNNFVFGSEIKPMLKCGIAPALNKDCLEKYFVFKYVPGDETLFAGIKRLPPASILECNITGGSFSINKFWELTEKEEYKKLSYNDAKNHLGDLLKEIILSQLMADVPVGTFFSGGLDSSVIAFTLKDYPQIKYYTARKSSGDIKKEGTISDFYYAARLAADLSLNIQPIDIGSAEMSSEFINLINFYSDDLIADGSQIPSYLITREAKKTSTVLLSGMGGDELFYGYAGHQLTLLSSYFDIIPGFISNPLVSKLKNLSPGRGHFKAYKRYLKKFGHYYSKGNLRLGLFNIVGDYYNSISVLNSSDGSAVKHFDNYFSNIKSSSSSREEIFKAITRFELNNFLVKNLHYLDRMCMANSAEGRVPFLDYRLVEFACSLPLHYRLSRLGKIKTILKDSYRNKLPAYILKRRKAGFGMPMRSIFSSEKKIKELLDEEFFSYTGYFSINNINRIIRNHINGSEDNSSIIYALISFQHWYKMFIKS